MIRKEKVFLSFLISFFFPLLLLSQTAPPIQWQNTIGGTKGEELAKIFVNNIGNYIIGGS